MTLNLDDQTTQLRDAIDALMRRFKIAEQGVDEGKPLNQIDVQALLFIQSRPQCGPTDVARFLGVAPTTISSVTDRLVARDFLTREHSETNRRAITLGLTETGAAYVDALIEAQKSHCRSMLDALSPGEQEDFVRLMSKIAQNDY